MSPVGVDGMIVVLIGTNDDGAIAAYDAKSGAQKWIWKGDGPAYASPVVVEIGGVKQVVTLTQKNAVGLSLSSGELLWKINFPGRDHVWVGGYHRYEGNAYHWQAGRWEQPPRAHAVWVAPRYTHRHDGYVYSEGHWR